MPTIEILESFGDAKGGRRKGQVVQASKQEADDLIRIGRAKITTKKPKRRTSPVIRAAAMAPSPNASRGKRPARVPSG